MNVVRTKSELEALELLRNSGMFMLNTTEPQTTEAINYILLLAERIKNERMNVIMQKVGHL